MITPNHRRLTEIFLRVADLTGEEREAALEHACRHEPELRVRVERMLSHDRDAPDALNTGAFRIDAIADPPLLPEPIGPYEVLELVGEGGMGVVYRAVQRHPIHRQVALKIILPGFETRQVVARFESERQTLALMDHPNIARVIDAGATSHGRPFFVMEYVDGRPITDYCDDHRLGLEARLELFRQVCDGVQHAHQNAILHRDLKPSNILVTVKDGSPVPKIIDFGVAKALERNSASEPLTEAGRQIGTPGYISPEQIAGDIRRIDTRADVYALGVLLYELLAGAPPFDAKQVRRLGRNGYHRMIHLQDPPLPSVQAGIQSRPEPCAWRRRLAGDIDCIVLKALEKEPERRYATPSALAADLERYLRHEPVVAGPPSATYRARKFVRRNRAAVTLATVFLVTVLVFTAAVVFQANRAAREARSAKAQAETVHELTEFLVSDLFQVSNEIGPRTDLRSGEELVATGTDQAMEKLADRPLLRARMQHTLGNVKRRLQQYVAAHALLEEAHAGLSRLLGPTDHVTLRCASDLARVKVDLMRYDEAETLYATIIDARQATAGADAPDTLRGMSDLALLLKSRKKNERAASLFEATVDGLRRTLGEDHRETLIAAGFLAGVYLELDRLDRVEVLLRKLESTMPEVLGFDHIETHAAWYNLACLHARRDAPERALFYLEKSVSRGFGSGLDLRADRHLASLRGDPRFETLARMARDNQPASWAAYNRRGIVAIQSGTYAEAELQLLRVVDAARRKPKGLDELRAREALDWLAYLYIKQARYDEAEDVLNELLAHVENAPGAGLEKSHILWSLAQCDLGRDHREAARTRIAQANASLVGEWPTFRSAYLTAVELALTGDRTGALEQLEIASSRGPTTGFEPETDLAFEFLRGDPRFESIVRRITVARDEG